MKKTDALWGRTKRQLSLSWWLPQSDALFLILLSVKWMDKERLQSPQVLPTGLTEDYNYKTLSTLRPKLKHAFSSPFLTVRCCLFLSVLGCRMTQTVLCTLWIYTLLRKNLHISDWPIHTGNTVFLVGQSFHKVPSHSSTHSYACKTDNSWIAEHENNFRY